MCVVEQFGVTDVSENATFQALPSAHCPKNSSLMPRCNGPSGSLRIFSLSISRHRTGLTRHLRCIMRFFYSTLVLSLCAAFCHAQAATDEATFLKQARAKYDAPFERNLESFNCAVEFNWKQHFTEVIR